VSHRAISKQQFAGQLKMFMSPDELIDTTNKLDSRFYDPYENTASAGPREQWEGQHSSRYPTAPGMSLREEKLGDFEHPEYEHDFKKPLASMPPVELMHYRAAGSRRPQFNDGHHRLAWAEARKIPYMAVVHQIGEV
jgi:hypothetical protein